MKHSLVLAFDSIEEMQSTIAKLGVVTTTTQAAPAVVNPQPVGQTVAQPAPPQPVQQQTAPVTIDKIKELAIQLCGQGKVPQVKAVNDTYGLAKISDAQPQHYDAIYKQLLEVSNSPV